jgi:hypothetical protein
LPLSLFISLCVRDKLTMSRIKAKSELVRCIVFHVTSVFLTFLTGVLRNRATGSFFEFIHGVIPSWHYACVVPCH